MLFVFERREFKNARRSELRAMLQVGSALRAQLAEPVRDGENLAAQTGQVLLDHGRA